MPGFRAAAGIIAALFALAAPAAAQEANYARLFDALWTTVNENFYDPHFRGADWEAQRDRYRPRVAGVRTNAEFRALAAEMLGEIPSSHLHVSPPEQAARGAGVGARFTEMGGDLVVSEIGPLSDAYMQGLRPGDRLLSDRSALYGDLGTIAEVRVRTCEGGRRTLNIRREHVFWPPEHPSFRWRQVRVGPDRRIGYMRVDRFDDGAAALADQAMSEFENVDAIIIDVRHNSGGNVSALRLASYFNGGRAEPGIVLLARPYLESLGRPVTAADTAAAPRINGAYTGEAVFAAVSEHNGGAAFWVDAIDDGFSGPVFVLISEETGSAAEGFAWYMRLRTQAHLMGVETAGELLSSDRFDIGDGWSVTIPVHGLWGPDGEDYGDRAVSPQEVIPTTREDLCSGRDPVLAAALRQASR